MSAIPPLTPLLLGPSFRSGRPVLGVAFAAVLVAPATRRTRIPSP